MVFPKISYLPGVWPAIDSRHSNGESSSVQVKSYLRAPGCGRSRMDVMQGGMKEVCMSLLGGVFACVSFVVVYVCAAVCCCVRDFMCVCLSLPVT